MKHRFAGSKTERGCAPEASRSAWQKIVAARFGEGGRLNLMAANIQGGFVRKNRLRIGTVIFLFFLLLVGSFFYQPASPDGVYYDPDIGCFHGVWIFADRKVFIQCVGDGLPREFAAYHKSDGHWLVGTNGTNIKTSVWGITWDDPNHRSEPRFWFRDSIAWMSDCKIWFDNHWLEWLK